MAAPTSAAGAGGRAEPPRSLNVQRLADARIPEIQSLHSLLSARLSDRFRLPRSLRRRTTSHSRKRRRSTTTTAPPLHPCTTTAAHDLCRRERRRRELSSNPLLGFVTAADGTRRLRTHLWHAKRFRMLRAWGFCLPLGAQGRGRGARALLRSLQKAALLHDASYFLPLQLEGPQDCLISVLRMVLVPAPPLPSQMPPDHPSHAVLRGASHQDAMLYHRDPSSARYFIAPVKYMWQTVPSQTDQSQHLSTTNSTTSQLRKLWIWIHAAAFHEGCNALRAACEIQQLHADGGTISCVAQDGRIARLDIMGTKASELIGKIVCPVPISDETGNSDMDPCTTSVAQKQFNRELIEKLPPGSILTLRVKDPRLISSESILEFEKVPVDLDPSNTPKLYANNELWDPHCKIDPPMPESILCIEKNKERLNALFLEPPDLEMPAGQQTDGFSRSCTVILLRHAYQTTCLGWSIILPLSWVKPFWLSMVSRGGHAIGLRERRWVAWKNKVPCFPYDFPDTQAYKSMLTDQRTLYDESAMLRPHTKQPHKTPMSAPWDCVAATFHHICTNSMQCKVPISNIYIPRTTEALKDCVEEMDSGDQVSAGRVEIKVDGREKGSVCLVRVLISAFKEGLFEDGAVICAPCTDDLSGWTTRSVEEVEEYQQKWQLQLSQSGVESYFVEPESDKWALQVPEDPVDLKSFRWPIGFISGGAVHAWNDRVVMGYCEIKSLAALRRQQYLHTQTERPQIYVLVRNLKSTAYRRAIARIVLEQQQEDVQSL